jgi:hypothetical protein
MRSQPHRPRQAGAEIKITEEMIQAGMRELGKSIPLVIAQPLMAEEDIVAAIYRAMRALEFSQ